MPQLRQLDLQFTLVGSRPLGKNIENQTRAGDDPTAQLALQIALLTGRQGVVEHHQLGLEGLFGCSDLLEFSRANKGLGGGRATVSGNKSYRLAAG